MIIKLGGFLQLKIVGECAETEKQSRLLRLLQCDQMQGNLFSSPGSVDVLDEEFLAGLPKQQQRPA
jgi:EAL domain-containing protein (putative c-di-GMP-specific phosphodiesterase class I)